MTATADCLCQTKPTTKAIMASVRMKKRMPDLIIQPGRSWKKMTTTVTVRTARLSSTRSTTTVPSAEDILMELFFAIR